MRRGAACDPPVAYPWGGWSFYLLKFCFVFFLPGYWSVWITNHHSSISIDHFKDLVSVGEVLMKPRETRTSLGFLGLILSSSSLIIIFYRSFWWAVCGTLSTTWTLLKIHFCFPPFASNQFECGSTHQQEMCHLSKVGSVFFFFFLSPHGKRSDNYQIETNQQSRLSVMGWQIEAQNTLDIPEMMTL